MNKFIELKNLSKFYVDKGQVNVGLDKINVSFEKTGFVAITGESGSGKSTLMNVLAGLDTYENGEMFVNGKSTISFSEEDWIEYRKSYISFIFQDYKLIECYNVFENLELILFDKYPKSKVRKNVVENIIKRVDLWEERYQVVSTLSGGQKQRVSIARALAQNSPVIIADEPCGNLDQENTEKIIDLLYSISKDKLVIIVTHNYEEVENCATRKIRLYDSKIIEDKKVHNENKSFKIYLDRNYPKYDNKKKVKYLVKKNLTKTPKKTALLMTSLFLVSLLFLVMGLMSNIKIINLSSEDCNLYSVKITKKNNDKIETFSDEDIKNLEKSPFVSYVEKYDKYYRGSTNINGNTLRMRFSNMKFLTEEDLLAGRMPCNANEIILPSNSHDGVDINLLNKDALKFDFNPLTIDKANENATNENSTNVEIRDKYNNNNNDKQTEIIKKETLSFKVVGICKSNLMGGYITDEGFKRITNFKKELQIKMSKIDIDDSFINTRYDYDYKTGYGNKKLINYEIVFDENIPTEKTLILYENNLTEFKFSKYDLIKLKITDYDFYLNNSEKSYNLNPSYYNVNDTLENNVEDFHNNLKDLKMDCYKKYYKNVNKNKLIILVNNNYKNNITSPKIEVVTVYQSRNINKKILTNYLNLNYRIIDNLNINQKLRNHTLKTNVLSTLIIHLVVILISYELLYFIGYLIISKDKNLITILRTMSYTKKEVYKIIKRQNIIINTCNYIISIILFSFVYIILGYDAKMSYILATVFLPLGYFNLHVLCLLIYAYIVFMILTVYVTKKIVNKLYGKSIKSYEAEVIK